jgi:hypothetical protein
MKWSWIVIIPTLFFGSILIQGCRGIESKEIQHFDTEQPPTAPSVHLETTIPTVTPTLTPTIVPTKEPVPLEGKLFFDINASGLQDKTEIIFFKAMLEPMDAKWEQNPQFIKVLKDYFDTHPLTKDREQITIIEPSLPNYEVCSNINNEKKGCALTDAEGNFTIIDSGAKEGDTVGISIIDKNENETGTMKYVNRFIRPVVIPAYKMNGVEVPEQDLSDTRISTISKIFYVKAGETFLDIGLMQGFMRYPPIEGEMYIAGLFDHDQKYGSKLNWMGNNKKMQENHWGTDFGAHRGNFVLATGPGLAQQDMDKKGAKSILISIANSNYPVASGHLDNYLVNNMENVFYGQIIGTNGTTGTNSNPHVHMDISILKYKYDPFGDPYGTYGQMWIRAMSPAEFP